MPESEPARFPAERPTSAAESVDPAVGAAGVALSRGGDGKVLAAIACGGVLGAELRYGLSRAIPHHGSQFPWSTVVINASGCFLLGVLMVVLLELASSPPRLARPFLGVGVLGGYTTFSTFAVDAQRLLMAHRPAVAAGYVVGTVLLGVLAVESATWASRRAGRQFAARRGRTVSRP